MESELEKVLDIAGHGRYNIMVLLVSSTIHLASILDLLGFCVIVPAAACDLKLGMREISLLTSIPFAGYLSALPWGYYVDTHGRRKAILISTSVGAVFATLTTFSTSFTMMLVLKLLGCLFSTASITLSITYLGECTGTRNRTRYLLILNCFNLISDFICYALAYLILGLQFEIPLPWLAITFRPWRLLTLVMAVMLAVGGFVIFFLHESPKFLATKGRVDEALEVMKTGYGLKDRDVDLVKSLLTVTKDTGNERKLPFMMSLWQQTAPIFSRPYLMKTLQLFFLLAVCTSTNNVFYIWFPTIVNSFYNAPSNATASFCDKITSNITADVHLGETCNDVIADNTIFSGMAFSLFFTIINYIASMITSWRKSVLVGTLLISGMSTVVVDLVEQPVISLLLFILIQLVGLSAGNVASYFVDVYPTSFRGLSTSLGSMFARMTVMVGINIVGSTIVQHCRATFLSWSIFVFVGMVVACFLPKETTTTRNPLFYVSKIESVGF